MVTSALNQLMTGLLPNKVLQCVKRYLRREARKPFDMNIKSYYMNITRINSEEIPKLPPNFAETQSLAEDEIVDILLYGTPKSWQKEMDHRYQLFIHTSGNNDDLYQAGVHFQEEMDYQ